MSETRTNQEWVEDLNSRGLAQEAAIAELRNILLRAALYFFSRNLSDFGGFSHDEILQQAEDCAQDALLAVMQHLPDFRGDSKFSTWAYKFAINHALMTARRERWKGVSLDDLAASSDESLADWVLRDQPAEATPEQSAIQEEVRKIILEVIAGELTGKQRQVLVWMVFKEVPLDEVARHLGTNRNAVYKILHDARRKLKSGLQKRGFEVEETLALFS